MGLQAVTAPKLVRVVDAVCERGHEIRHSRTYGDLPFVVEVDILRRNLPPSWCLACASEGKRDVRVRVATEPVEAE